MFDTDLAPLRAIGLSPLLWQRAQAVRAAEPALRPLPLARVTEVQRDGLRLHDGRAPSSAACGPALRRRLLDDGRPLTVGDWVWHDRAGHVVDLLPDANLLVRRDAHARRHVLVANVDTVLVVMGLDGDFNPRRLERYLALVQGQDLPALVVLTKVDLAGTAAAAAALVALHRRLPPMPERLLDVLAVDATDPATADRLAPWLTAGRTLVLLGSSGAGKSTLANTLLGAARRDTGAVRRRDDRGQHTTTVRSLLPLPGGACLIDTPGLRALQPDLGPERLAASFDDVQRLALLCRFRDCAHASEPGCAVRAGVDPDRLRNYGQLLREAGRDALSPLQRRERIARWRTRDRDGALRARLKRGGPW